MSLQNYMIKLKLYCFHNTMHECDKFVNYLFKNK